MKFSDIKTGVLLATKDLMREVDSERGWNYIIKLSSDKIVQYTYLVSGNRIIETEITDLERRWEERTASYKKIVYVAKLEDKQELIDLLFFCNHIGNRVI